VEELKATAEIGNAVQNVVRDDWVYLGHFDNVCVLILLVFIQQKEDFVTKAVQMKNAAEGRSKKRNKEMAKNAKLCLDKELQEWKEQQEKLVSLCQGKSM
jgi:hypothetical protein